MTTLCDTPSDYFSFVICYNQAIKSFKSKIWKLLTLRSNIKQTEYLCSRTFEKKGADFTNVARIFRFQEIIKSLPTASVKFSTSLVTLNLTQYSSPNFSKFNDKIANDLDLDNN